MNNSEAEWVDRDGNPSTGEDKRHIEIFCSNCKKIALGYPFWECDLYPSIYCPHCGKKMKNGKVYEYKDDDVIVN